VSGLSLLFRTAAGIMHQIHAHPWMFSLVGPSPRSVVIGLAEV
jgi:hypothetical protein